MEIKIKESNKAKRERIKKEAKKNNENKKERPCRAVHRRAVIIHFLSSKLALYDLETPERARAVA